MKRPTHLQVGPYNVPVEYVKTMPDDSGQFCAAPNPIIQINDRVRDYNLPSTLFHEAIHAAIFFHGLDCAVAQNEETVVRFIEHVVPDIINRNKFIRKGLGYE